MRKNYQKSSKIQSLIQSPIQLVQRWPQCISVESCSDGANSCVNLSGALRAKLNVMPQSWVSAGLKPTRNSYNVVLKMLKETSYLEFLRKEAATASLDVKAPAVMELSNLRQMRPRKSILNVYKRKGWKIMDLKFLMKEEIINTKLINIFSKLMQNQLDDIHDFRNINLIL